MDPLGLQHYNRGNALLGAKHPDEALAQYDAALARLPGFALAWNNRGVALRQLGRTADAHTSFTRAVTARPDYAQAFFNRATVAGIDASNYAAAIADLERALALDPAMLYARGLLLHQRMFACDWRNYDADVAALDVDFRAGRLAAEPFVYQAVARSPSDLRRCAELYAGLNYPAAPPLWRASRHDRIRLGYVSGEFRAQATAYLAARLYELHDREKFEVVAIDNGGGDGSAMRARLEAGFDRILDIRGVTDDMAAARIVDAQIDILINLNGYFGEERMGVFARRPAPVQVNYLGFPGTLGASYMDYIVADGFVIPPVEARHYTEQVAWLPDAYQVNDDRRQIASATTRAAHGLPEGAFVFCNFNTVYKLTPACFAAWMRLLQQVPGSVLWLLESNALAAANLRAEAARQGVEDARLIFAPPIALDRHLARIALADLFLDTLPCNAHTTASDALWAGVPLLTCRGTAFSGRVAESLLNAAGLPELVTGTMPDYEALALRLARDPVLLASLRSRLAANRLRAPLFDTVRFTRHLEAAYGRMWDGFRRGEAPRAFTVEPIS